MASAWPCLTNAHKISAKLYFIKIQIHPKNTQDNKFFERLISYTTKTKTKTKNLVFNYLLFFFNLPKFKKTKFLDLLDSNISKDSKATTLPNSRKTFNNKNKTYQKKEKQLLPELERLIIIKTCLRRSAWRSLASIS